MVPNLALERTLTQLDYVRLTRLLSISAASPETAEAVGEVLSASELVASPEVAPDVVTMYSQVSVAMEDGTRRKLTLCYPDDAEPAQGFISVMAPMGLALLGLRVGERAQWRAPGGQACTAHIEAMLFQPEASGDYTT